MCLGFGWVVVLLVEVGSWCSEVESSPLIGPGGVMLEGCLSVAVLKGCIIEVEDALIKESCPVALDDVRVVAIVDYTGGGC